MVLWMQDLSSSLCQADCKTAWVLRRGEEGWNSGQGAVAGKCLGCWEGSFCGLDDSWHIRNEGDSAIKAASLTLNSAGWEHNGTSNKKKGWAQRRGCALFGGQWSWRCLWDHQRQFPVGSWKWEMGTRARVADIRKEERKRLMLYRSSLVFTQSSLGRKREHAFRKKINWVKVTA